MTDLGCLSRLIVEFCEKISSWEQSVVRDGPLTLEQMHTLTIVGHQISVRMKELAATMGVTTGTMTVTVDKLEKLGLVRRVAHKTDRRVVLVALTATGQEIFAEHEAHHLRLSQDLAAALSVAETKQFKEILAKLVQAI